MLKNDKNSPISLLAQLSCIITIFTTVLSAQVHLSSSNLPIIIINTYGQNIVDEKRIIADMGVIDNGIGKRNYISDPYNNYNGKIGIELRGSSSMSWPKKQYRVETIDANGEDLNVPLLGFPAEADWVFHGPYDDKTFIRNVLPFVIMRKMGRYASRTRYFELIINGDYKGIYVLMEKIKRDKNRVNISKCEPQDTTGDAVTGGYIIKLDKIEGENIGYWYSPNGIQYQYDYPKPNRITPQQKKYIQNFIYKFETIMKSNKLDDPILGYPSIIDVGSFVDYFLINELCRNIDAYRLSTFLYKDRDSRGGKLFAGPIWDMNLTFGHAWYDFDRNFYTGWEIDHNKRITFDSPKIPFWWKTLVRRPGFARQAAQRWFELRNTTLHLDSIFAIIDSLKEEIQEAQYRNYLRWPEMGNQTTFNNEITSLKNWIMLRTYWIDNNIEKLSSIELTPDNQLLENFQLHQNYPNPFNSSTNIKYTIPIAGWVKLNIFDIHGAMVKTIVSQYQEPGEYSISLNSEGLSTGIYFYQLTAGNFKATQKMIVLK